jgi:hypothetical protein
MNAAVQEACKLATNGCLRLPNSDGRTKPPESGLHLPAMFVRALYGFFLKKSTVKTPFFLRDSPVEQEQAVAEICPCCPTPITCDFRTH